MVQRGPRAVALDVLHDRAGGVPWQRPRDELEHAAARVGDLHAAKAELADVATHTLDAAEAAPLGL